jgi:hypothetical protein
VSRLVRVSLIQVGSGQQKTETWAFLMGPTLTHQQFHRAIGTATISHQSMSIRQLGPAGFVSVNSVEANWDDESQRVEVRIEVYLSSQDLLFNVGGFRYSITILAEL